MRLIFLALLALTSAHNLRGLQSANSTETKTDEPCLPGLEKIWNNNCPIQPTQIATMLFGFGFLLSLAIIIFCYPICFNLVPAISADIKADIAKTTRKAETDAMFKRISSSRPPQQEILSFAGAGPNSHDLNYNILTIVSPTLDKLLQPYTLEMNNRAVEEYNSGRQANYNKIYQERNVLWVRTALQRTCIQALKEVPPVQRPTIPPWSLYP